VEWVNTSLVSPEKITLSGHAKDGAQITERDRRPIEEGETRPKRVHFGNSPDDDIIAAQRRQGEK